jgi:predicted transcriptional regulator
MTRRHTSPPPLTELQQTILDFISSNGPSTAEQVRESLLPGRSLKDATIRTLLRRLEDRGYLSHRLDGKMFKYEAKLESRSIAAKTVRQIIDRFWSGSAEEFLVGLVDEEILTAREIKRLADKLKKR